MKKKYQIYIINGIIIILIAIFLFSTYRFLRLSYFKESSRKANEKIIEKVIIPLETSDKEEEDEIFTVDFQKLKEINSDVIGWIYIPGTKINYPIVQRQDNSYYLTHDINKKYNILGSIFMNSSNHSDFSDSNTILFGHNNHQDNLMFTDLKEIYDGNLGNQLDIYIYTEEKNYIYQIYSVYLATPSDESPLNTAIDFFDRTEREFLYDQTDIKKTLTLSTCYKDSSKRIIIHASRSV